MFFYRKIIILEIIVIVIVSFNWIKNECAYNDFWKNPSNNGNAKIISFKEEKEYKNQYIILYQNHRFILYTDRNVDFQYGDVIRFIGYFEKAKSSGNFKLFDYADYLKQNRIYGILKAETIQKISTEKNMEYHIELWKKNLEQHLYQIFDEKQAGFLSGLLIGDKSKVLEETKQEFQDSSLSHVLAISGMHVIYVTIGTKWILDFITSRQRLKNVLMIFFLIFFAFFTGASPSCLRACIMCSFVFLSKIVYRKNDFYRSLLLSLDILLMMNCYCIKLVGLWLSYFATFGIVYFHITNTINSKTSKSKILNFILENIQISISCNIMIIPIIWNCYNKISLTFFVSNLFVSLLIGPIIILGYVHLFLGEISIGFVFLEKILLNGLFKIAKFFSRFRVSKILVPSIPIYFWIIYYVGVLSVKYFYCHKDLLQKWKNKLISGILILFIIGVLVFISQNTGLEMHFLDVGQGDCTLMITPKKKVVLIDGGNNEGYDYGKNVVVPYLLKNGFYQIDYMMISHRRF